jgi:hypothetical protein
MYTKGYETISETKRVVTDISTTKINEVNERVNSTKTFVYIKLKGTTEFINNTTNVT